MLLFQFRKKRMDYKAHSDKTFFKNDGKTLKAGARLHGDPAYSYLEISVDSGLHVSEWGATVLAQARGYLVQIFGEDSEKKYARLFGGHFGPSVGFDFQSFVEEGKVLGAEARACATLVEAEIKDCYVHLGSGLTTGAKVENGSAEMKVFGTGFKVGKWIGVSLCDNELAFNIRNLFKNN